MSTPITPHFSLEEFACHGGTPYPTDNVEDEPSPTIVESDLPLVLAAFSPGTWGATRLVPLCLTLETIRAATGGSPIHVDSGYRTLEYDDRLYQASAKDGSVAPASRSQHPKGRAADIVSGSYSPSGLYALVVQLFADGKLPYLGGCGVYRTFVHVDVRPRVPPDHLAQWSGCRGSNVA